jgi:hypothetical protein
VALRNYQPVAWVLYQRVIDQSKADIFISCSLMVPWKEQITFPVYHHPVQLVEINAFAFRQIPCYLFTILFISFKLFSSSIYYYMTPLLYAKKMTQT